METLKQLLDYLNLGIHPVIPRQGSVGASGDLCPLSHLAVTLLGIGYVNYKGKKMPTMGAHAVPSEYKDKADYFVDEILVKQMLPKVKEQGIAKFCDVFCEEGVYSIDQSRRILKAAEAMPLISVFFVCARAAFFCAWGLAVCTLSGAY